MKRLFLLLSFSLQACGQSALCTSQGVSLAGVTTTGAMPDEWTCARFAVALYAVLDTFDEEQPQFNFEQSRALRQLSGYTISVHPEKSFYSAEHGQEVSGLTMCGTRQILVGNRPLGESDIFAHEIVHAVQGCVVPDHRDWDQENQNGATIRGTVNKAATRTAELISVMKSEGL